MRNSELIDKVKKEGIKSLSDFELRRLANVSWKTDMFTLNGLTKYVQSGKNEYINRLLEKNGLENSIVSTKWITKNCKPGDLKRKKKDEKTGKLVVTDEKKEYFSLWFISGIVQSFAAEIQAKVQSSQPKKAKKPVLSEGEQAKKDAANEVKKTASKVEQNKRSNAAATRKHRKNESAKKAA